jgi:tRNA A58 N-methylase Trm61
MIIFHLQLKPGQVVVESGTHAASTCARLACRHVGTAKA